MYSLESESRLQLVEHIEMLQGIYTQMLDYYPEFTNLGIALPAGGGAIESCFLANNTLIVDQTPFYAYNERILPNWQAAERIARRNPFRYFRFKATADVSPAVQIAQQLNLLGISLTNENVSTNHDGSTSFSFYDWQGHPRHITYLECYIPNGQILADLVANILGNDYGVVFKAFEYGANIINQMLIDSRQGPTYFFSDRVGAFAFPELASQLYSHNYSLWSIENNCSEWGYQNRIGQAKNVITVGIKRH